MSMSNQEYRDLLEEIDDLGEDLSQWEIDFVEDMITKTSTNAKYPFSDKQKGQILRIHRERVE